MTILNSRHDGRHEQVALTRAELEVLAALDDLKAELGYAPTYDQMLARLNWRSRGALHEYLERLRAKRVIEGRGRALQIVR